MSERKLCVFCGNSFEEFLDNKTRGLFTGSSLYELLFNNDTFDMGKDRFITRVQLEDLLKTLGPKLSRSEDYELIEETDPRNTDNITLSSVRICTGCSQQAREWLTAEIPLYWKKPEITTPRVYRIDKVRDYLERMHDASPENRNSVMNKLVPEFCEITDELERRDSTEYFCWFVLKPADKTLFYCTGLTLTELLSLGFQLTYRVDISPDDFELFLRKFENLPAERQLVKKELPVSPEAEEEFIRQLSDVFIFTDHKKHSELLQRFLRCRVIISDSAIYQIFHTDEFD